MQLTQPIPNHRSIPLTKDDLLESYDEMIRSSLQLILKNLKENNKLSELKDWLLPMLMNG